MLKRREFLVSVASCVTILLDDVPAHAWSHGRLSAFNGGRSQVNFNFIDGQSGEFPFINILKTAQSWAWRNGTNSPITPDLLDANGYPTTFSNLGFSTVMFAPTVTERPGNYIVMLFGEGTADITGAGGLAGSAGVWTRYVVNTNSSDGRIVFALRTRGVSSYISNVAIFHVNDEAAYLLGSVFGGQFLQVLRQAKFGVLRFVNWQVANTTSVTTFATLRSPNYFTYGGTEARANIYAGVTTNVANAYSVAAPPNWTGLVDKATITVLFNASATQSGTCSLNVASTGDINILNQASGALSVGTNSYPEGGSFRSMATLIYDATLNAWIKKGGDVAANSQGLNNGCPLEIMIQLCDLVGAHPWIVAPPYAVDPMTDYHTRVATYVKAIGPSWMIPRFETCNELFNTFSGFDQTGYANAKAAAYVVSAGWAGGSNYQSWQGKILSTIGQAVSAVYGGQPDGTKYQVVCGVQTITFSTTAGANANDPRVTSDQYLAQSTAAQSGYAKTAGYLVATHAACANYFAPGDYNTAAETTAAANYAAAAGNAALQLSIVTAYADTVAGAATGFNLANTNSLYGFFRPWTQKFTNNAGLKLKQCGYEGGYSPDVNVGETAQVKTLRLASKVVADIGKSLTGGTLTSGATVAGTYVDFTNSGGEYPSCFQLGGSDNIWSVWDPNVYVVPTPSQGLAIMMYNQ